ncbi:(2,3-dihydroxybenzoyl)adenylate synthase [Streptomyces sp. NPDC087300]|uniref:(2,3-dihydroxybenzoyl)adenylate synthase n=1 Tax=Streptomyces sp. NPDC087300 TaxID=3365780 RepID=UPI00381AF45E
MLEGCAFWPADVAGRYRQDGYWLGRSLGDLLARSCADNAAKTAVVSGGRRITYGELGAGADRLASGLLGLGLRPLDRIVVQMPNLPELMTVLLAVFRAGVIPVLALPGHRKNEIVHLCAHSGAIGYLAMDDFCGQDYRALAREVCEEVPGIRHVLISGDPQEFTSLESLALTGQQTDGADEFAPVDPSDPALFLLSGGTTGLPKLIPRTHDDYAYNMLATARGLRIGPDDVYLAVNPAAHNAALGCPGVLGTLLVGGKVVLAAGPRPQEAFELIRREEVTLTTLVPPLVRMWVDAAEKEPVDLSALTLQVGSSKFNPAEAERARKVLGCRLSQWYGIGEGLLTYTRLDDPDDIVFGTEGRPMAAADEIRVCDPVTGQELPDGTEGELCTRGPYTIRGYYDAPEVNARSFTADGFFRTGDLVVRRPDGNIVVTGRLKDVINRAGDKVPAEEVEKYLLTHPSVQDAAVVGMPDPVLGERSHAFVLTHDGALRGPALKAFLRTCGLATYKIPDKVLLRDAFPYTAVGKVDKGALRAALEVRPTG